MNKIFAYNKPNEDQLTRMEKVREAFSQLHLVIFGQDATDTTVGHPTLLQPSRYASLAATTIEEAAMWTMKAIGHE